MDLVGKLRMVIKLVTGDHTISMARLLKLHMAS